MKKEDFLKGMTILGTAYNKEFTKEQIEIWYTFLNKYTLEDFSSAIQELIKTEKYLPTIAHITEQIAKSKTSCLPKAEDEWNKVIESVRKYGSYREQEALKSLNNYTAYIVKHIGFKNICMTTDQTWNKKTFISEYEAMKDKEIENIQIGNIKELKMIGE